MPRVLEDIEPTLGKNDKKGKALKMKIVNTFFRSGISSFGRHRSDPRKNAKRGTPRRMKIFNTF